MAITVSGPKKTSCNHKIHVIHVSLLINETVGFSWDVTVFCPVEEWGQSERYGSELHKNHAKRAPCNCKRSIIGPPFNDVEIPADGYHS